MAHGSYHEFTYCFLSFSLIFFSYETQLDQNSAINNTNQSVKENAKVTTHFTTKCLQTNVAMNVIGRLQHNKWMLEFQFILFYFIFCVIGDTLVCKSYMVEFVVLLASLIHKILLAKPNSTFPHLKTQKLQSFQRWSWNAVHNSHHSHQDLLPYFFWTLSHSCFVTPLKAQTPYISFLTFSNNPT